MIWRQDVMLSDQQDVLSLVGCGDVGHIVGTSGLWSSGMGMLGSHLGSFVVLPASQLLRLAGSLFLCISRLDTCALILEDLQRNCR